MDLVGPEDETPLVTSSHRPEQGHFRPGPMPVVRIGIVNFPSWNVPRALVPISETSCRPDLAVRVCRLRHIFRGVPKLQDAPHDHAVLRPTLEEDLCVGRHLPPLGDELAARADGLLHGGLVGRDPRRVEEDPATLGTVRACTRRPGARRLAIGWRWQIPGLSVAEPFAAGRALIRAGRRALGAGPASSVCAR